MEQLAIPEECFVPISQLVGNPDRDEEAIRGCLDWLMSTHGCSSGVVPYVKRLFAEFGRCEAWDRSHALLYLYGMHGEGGWTLADAEFIGLYDHAITDYHVLWDRGWAVYLLVPRELVPKVWKCSYGGRPKFWDKEGSLLFQSVYSEDGHVLTREQRRQALESAGAI